MGLDVRLPLGLLFASIGALLVAFGALGDQAIYARSLGVNVNLWWGLVMLAVGVTLIWLNRRYASGLKRPNAAIEMRSRAGDLEAGDTQ